MVSYFASSAANKPLSPHATATVSNVVRAAPSRQLVLVLLLWEPVRGRPSGSVSTHTRYLVSNRFFLLPSCM